LCETSATALWKIGVFVCWRKATNDVDDVVVVVVRRPTRHSAISQQVIQYGYIRTSAKHQYRKQSRSNTAFWPQYGQTQGIDVKKSVQRSPETQNQKKTKFCSH